MPNPLDPILAWYLTAKDAIEVTHHAVTTNIAAALTAAHVLHTQTDAEKLAALNLAQTEIDQLGVLALVATCERTLRDFLGALPVVVPATGDRLRDAVRMGLLNDMEMWNLSSRVIDLFAAVDPAIRGQVKQIVKYRNWVAHGRTRTEPPPVVILPPAAHRRLSDFLLQAGAVVP